MMVRQETDNGSSLLAGVKSIAVAGVSSNRRKFGSMAARELKRRGFTVFPINPGLQDFEGGRCYSNLEEAAEPPDCVLISVKQAGAAGEIVSQAIKIGARMIWFQQGVSFDELARSASEAGLRVVEGRCILMYAEPVGGIHGFHRWLARLFGKY